jgi:hypothetical protein
MILLEGKPQENLCFVFGKLAEGCPKSTLYVTYYYYYYALFLPNGAS